MAIYFCLSFLFSFLYLFTASAYTVWFGTYVGVLAINLPKMFVTQTGKMKYIIRLGRSCQCDLKKINLLLLFATDNLTVYVKKNRTLRQ